MQTYSQRDPAYDRKFLGNSKRTIHSDGCFLTSLATLYQRHPVELLDVPNAFAKDGSGNLVSGVIAQACGGSAEPATTTPPKGWFIAVTDFYASQGFATHFFLANVEQNLQIDPLDFPAKIEPLKYPIRQCRPFTNTKLAYALTQPPIFSDVAADRPTASAIKLCKERGLVNGYPDGSFKPTQPITREEVCVILARMLQA